MCDLMMALDVLGMSKTFCHFEENLNLNPQNSNSTNLQTFELHFRERFIRDETVLMINGMLNVE